MNFIGLIEYAHRTFVGCSDSFRYMALLIGSAIYIYIKDKRKLPQTLVLGSFLIIMLFAFPPVIQIGHCFWGEEGYVNVLKLMPTLLLIGYAALKHFFELGNRKQRSIWVCVCILLLLLSGKYTYFKVFSTEIIQNKYYIDDEYMEICSTIPLRKETKILSCNTELAKAIRRIDGESRLVYGSDIETGNYSNEVKDLYNYLKQDSISLHIVMELAIAEGTTHVILYKWKDYEGTLEELLDLGKLSMHGETENYWSFAITGV